MPEREVPDGLIPHRGPARLVQTILEDPRPDVLVCGGRIPADSAFAAGGRVPAVVVLELAAQAAAVQQALAAPAGDAARPGYLVAIRAASLSADEVAAGVRLIATVRRTGQAGPLATYDVTVNGPGGEEIASATLSTHAGG
jgi:predicted hotdog family 3-hydroxylacyl-ACP dehydratase